MPDDAPLRVTLLGTGTSTGVPVIGCDCRVCTSDDSRDDRTRTACWVRAGATSLLIDTGPDFRRQALRESIRRVDAVLFTHHHFDHIVGMDDLRPFFFDNDSPIPCYARPNTAALLRQKFPHIFGENPYPGAARLVLRELDGPFTVSPRYADGVNIDVEPVTLCHGDLPTSGYRIGSFAYLTDVSRIPESSFAQLEGQIDTLVLDALRRTPHPTHFNFEQAIRAARRLGARQTYFVHMTHSVLHAEEAARLPEDMQLGYDGLSFTVER